MKTFARTRLPASHTLTAIAKPRALACDHLELAQPHEGLAELCRRFNPRHGHHNRRRPWHQRWLRRIAGSTCQGGLIDRTPLALMVIFHTLCGLLALTFQLPLPALLFALAALGSLVCARRGHPNL